MALRQRMNEIVRDYNVAGATSVRRVGEPIDGAEVNSRPIRTPTRP
jgi:hypothetical protein